MSTRIRTDSPSIGDFGKDVERALRRAVRGALVMHKRLGNPIAAWKDGGVVIIPPEEIVIPPDDSETEK
jgi:hypothetical protein